MFALIHLQNAFTIVFSTEGTENFEKLKFLIKLKNFKFFDTTSNKKTSHI